MVSKLIRRRVITAKVESTYNTDAVPAGTDAVLVEEINWGLEGLRMIERPAIRNSLGQLQHVYGGSLFTLSFRCEVKGSGAAGTAPEIGTLLRGCAMSETIVPATSVTYAPVSDSQESLTFYLFEDGTRTIVTGARGSVDFSVEVGNRLMANFNFVGHFSGPADVAMETPTYDSTVPVPALSSSFTVDGFSAKVAEVAFSPGIEVQVPPDLNAADGYGEVLCTSRDVNGSINPEQDLVANHDFMTKLRGGAAMALNLGTIGSTAGNIYQVTMPAVYYRNLSPGEREGVQIYDLPFGAAESSGDDEFSLIFT